MNKGKFVLGTVLGAAAGVVAGVLTAPKSGQETRADLKVKAAELKAEAARRADEMKMHGNALSKTKIEKDIDSVAGKNKKNTDDTL